MNKWIVGSHPVLYLHFLPIDTSGPGSATGTWTLTESELDAGTCTVLCLSSFWKMNRFFFKEKNFSLTPYKRITDPFLSIIPHIQFITTSKIFFHSQMLNFPVFSISTHLKLTEVLVIFLLNYSKCHQTGILK